MMKRFRPKIIQYSNYLKKIPFPGGKGATLYDILHVFYSSFNDLKLPERAAAISFNFLMSIPPSLIFLFSLVPFLPLASVQETIIDSIRIIAPNKSFFDTASSFVIDFMNTKRRDLLSVGFLISIYFSSNGIMGLLRSFDRDSPALIERTAWSRRLKSITLTLWIALLFLISISLLIVQTSVFDVLIENWYINSNIIKLLSWLTIVTIIHVIFSIIYKFGPSVDYRFGFFNVGATLATLFFILATYIFFYITSNFLEYNKIYGSIGTLMMMMAWMFLSGMIILIGYEINLSIATIEINKKKEKNQFIC